jgi:hypothetical protein
LNVHFCWLAWPVSVHPPPVTATRSAVMPAGGVNVAPVFLNVAA